MKFKKTLASLLTATLLSLPFSVQAKPYQTEVETQIEVEGK